MRIQVNEFGGQQPRVNERLLAPEKAQIAKNVFLSDGKINAFRGLNQEYALLLTPPIKSIYYLQDTYWLEDDEDVDYVKGPIKSDTSGLTLFTLASAAPRITDLTLAAAGAGAYPRDWLTLGLPAPSIGGVGVALVTPSGTITAAANGYAASTAASVGYTAVSGITAKITGTVVAVLTSTQREAGTLLIEIRRGAQVIASKQVGFGVRGQTSEPLDKEKTFTIEGVDQAPPAGATTYTLSVTETGFSGSATIVYDYAMVARHANLVDVTLNAGHGRTVGQRIAIAAVVGMTDLNSTWEILSVSGNTVRVSCDTLQTYTSGGTWTLTFNAEELESRSYVFTYTTLLGGQTMEGPASLPTTLVNVGLGQTVNITGLPGIAGGDYSFDKLRIYRTHLSEDNTTEYLYVSEIAAATTSYSDSVAGTALGEPIQSENWIAPPTTMVGIVATNDGVVIGYTKNVICPSEPYQVHAYPVAYQKMTHFDIVGLCPLGDGTVAVMTKGDPYILTGRHPVDYSLNRTELVEPCLSKRGIVDMGRYCLYPSPNGLVSIGPGRVGLVTETLFSKREWEGFYPATMFAVKWDDKYVGFYSSGGTYGGFIFDPDRPDEIVTLDFAAEVTEAWTHPRTGELYLAIAGNIKKFDAVAGSPMTYTWKSKRFVTPRRATFSACRVEGTGSNTLKFYMVTTEDGTSMELVHTEIVYNNKTFRLPSGLRSSKFEVEVAGIGRVHSIELVESLTELKQIP